MALTEEEKLKNQLVTVEIPAGGYMRMTKGLADYFVLNIQTGWPFVPVGARSKIGGLRTRAKAAGKLAFITFNNGETHSIRYSGKFKRVYGYLREVAPNWDDVVTEIATERRGSVASKYDSIIPET